MLFKDYHVDQIRRGLKTQTRRVWKKAHVKVGGVYAVQTYLLQPRSKAHGFIRVLDLRTEPLGTITTPDAQREGCRSIFPIAEFMRRWAEINGDWDAHQLVHVVSFEYVGETA